MTSTRHRSPSASEIHPCSSASQTAFGYVDQGPGRSAGNSPVAIRQPPIRRIRLRRRVTRKAMPLKVLSRVLLALYLSTLLWLVLFKLSYDIPSILENYQTRSVNLT